ncbi:MAG: PEPxxWA-CTERM sorting domain-containing protein [Sphingomicrobium sp.]
MKTFILGLVGAVALASSATVSAQVVYDANPQVPFTYGTGNDYTPANAVVLTSNARDDGYEIAGRAHVPGQPAATTGGTGIYTFDIGQNVSIDFSFFRTAITNALVTITNVGTGSDASFAAALLGTVQTNGALQGSQQLAFGFLNGTIDPLQNIDFSNAVNSTYRIDLSGGGQSVTYFAQIGTGAAVAAVPEPATWAMMLIGFGAMGVSLRRRRRTQSLLQAA